MKILFLTRLFYPHVGGIEKHIEKVCKELLEKGYKVKVLTTKFKKNLKEREIFKGIKIIRFKQPKIKLLGLLYTWYWILKNRRTILSQDIIHIHDVFIWYWPLKLLNTKKKVFVTFHGRWGKYPIPLVDRLQKKIGAKLSSGNISIGDYIPKHYGIKSSIISYGAVRTPAKSFKKNDNLIIYVGRLDTDIAFEKIFKVLKKLRRKYEIVFIGDGQLANEAKKIGKVTGFTNPVPYYKKATYLFASGYLTILEGLAYRCRVIAMYENPLQEDYYRSSEFNKFITISGNPNEIYKKLRGMKDDKKLDENGYRWAKSQTWEKMTNNYLKLWKVTKL